MKKISILTMAVLLLFAASAQADLVALYHLDGDATDSSGNANDGIEVGDPSYVAGVFDQAISLDGDDYVDCGNVLDVTDQLTLEAWVQDSGYSTGSVVGKWEANDKRWHIYVNSGVVDNKIYWNIGGSNWGTSDTADIQGDWYHLAMVYDGTQSGNSNRLKAYIDGSEIALNYSGTIPATMPAISANVNIGRQGSAPYFFNGEIDEVRIWDEALSGTDIEASASLENVEITKSLIRIFDPIGDLTDLNLDGYPLVPMATPITCEMEVTVSNGSSLDLSNVLVQDRMGAEWGLDSVSDPLLVLTETKGNSEKVFIDWMIASLQTSDPAVTLGIEATTDINPGNPGGKNKDKIHQEYTSPGVYEVNSASLGFCVTIADEEICLVKTADSIWVEAVGTDD